MPAGSGINSGANVEVVGLDDFRRELKQLDNAPRWTKELSKSQRTIGMTVAGWSRFEAAGLGGPFAHFADAIAGGGGVTGARIRIKNEDANSTFWGALRHFGWYADPRYSESTGQQSPDWVGNTWDAWAGEGPYAIASTIHRRADWIVDEYGNAIDRITADAFDYRNRISTF